MKPNPQQQQIIAHVNGPCLVTAVPGSGKTATLTERIRHLISRGIAPQSILAITFTNKAAQEMRKRIAKTVGEEAAELMTVRTFHSMCAAILRSHAARVGLRQGFSIYDQDDQMRMMRMCVVKQWEKQEQAGGKGSKKPKKPDDNFVKQIVQYTELLRNHCLTEEQAVTRSGLQNEQYNIANVYFEEMTKANAVDFTGLLDLTLRILREHPGVLGRLQERWCYISVDEVQDTNIVQYELLKLLAQHGNILVVGDIDQSIYGFRGANPKNILDFEKDFGATTLKLENNYRSTPQILFHAHQLIARNKFRKPTELKTDNPPGAAPRANRYATDDEMAADIAESITNLMRNGENPGEIAVFYRVNHVSRVIEKALRFRRIKYKIVGGTCFYDRKEVKISLAVLKMMANPNDRTSFERVAEFCCKGVGTRTIAKIFDEAVSSGMAVVDAARQRASQANRLANNLRPLMNAMSPGGRPEDVLRDVLRMTAFGDKLDEDSKADNDRRANVMELARDAQAYVDEGKSLDSYLQQVSLLSSQDEKGEGQEVLLMTMHASKGLEFDNVFMSHANGLIIPHKRCLEVEDRDERQRQIEEERRLFYVAMTRARRRLTICSCDSMGYGGQEYKPSAFIAQAGLKPRQTAVPPWLLSYSRKYRS